MESVDMLSDLRSNATELFRPPNEHEIGILVQSAQDRFLSWQFERLLNASADLLDRASEQRTILLGLLAHDLEQRLSLEASRLSARHEAARVKLGEDPMRDPIAHGMIPIFKMATASRTYGKISAFHFQQDAMLAELEKTDSAAQKYAATAQRRSLDAERQKFDNQTILSEREWQAEREDFARRAEAAKLAQEHAD